MEIVEIEGGIAAELWGLDLSGELDAETFAAWQDAHVRYPVLVIPSQNLAVERHVRHSERFGPLEDFPDPKDQAEGHANVLRVTNLVRATGEIKPVDDPGHKSFILGTGDWHTDSSFRAIPSDSSLLYAIEVPPKGGDTLFADTARAWAALSEARKAALGDIRVVHDFEVTRRRGGLPPRPEMVRKNNPPVTHPLVRTLTDGTKALLLGSHIDHVVDMDPDAGKALIEELTEWATRPEFVYRHRWRVGDLVMWDNRRTMHKAAPYDLPNDRRLLHRTTVAGTIAVQ